MRFSCSQGITEWYFVLVVIGPTKNGICDVIIQIKLIHAGVKV